MRNSQICSVACSIICLLACAADYGFGKLPVPTPHRLPIESFPTTVAGWRAGALLPVETDVQAKLPSAKIIERVYRDSAGHAVDLTLVTAKDSLDIHDPSVCLPSQGWKVVSAGTKVYGSQTIHVMNMDYLGESMEVYYWWTGFYPPKLSPHPWVQAAARLRSRLVHSRDGESLMVRIISANDDNDAQTLDNFTNGIMPDIDHLTASVDQTAQRVKQTK